MRTLRQCLLDTDIARLRAIASFWDVTLESNNPREAAFQLLQVMSPPEAIRSAYANLSSTERHALDALVGSGGTAVLRAFMRTWGEIRPAGPGRLEREQLWREPVSPVEGLWYRGWVFRTFQEGTGEPYEALFVPSDLLEHLPQAEPQATGLQLTPQTIPPDARSPGCPEMQDWALDDVCTLLAYVQNEPVHVPAGGGWPDQHVRPLLRQLRLPDRGRIAWLRHMVERSAWVRVSAEHRLRPDPEGSVAWLRAPSSSQRAALFAAWRDDPTWNDLACVPGLVLERTGMWRNDPLLARHAILQHLRNSSAGCCQAGSDAGAWYAVDAFVAAVRAADPDFQRPSGDYTTWYIRDTAGGTFLSGFESWEAVEGSLIRYLIGGPLHWLGLLQFCPAAPVDLFRLSAEGRALLHGAETPSPGAAAGPPLEVRADFTVRVPASRRYERFQLARVANWCASGDPYVYRLTAGSLKRARAQDISVQRAIEFLSKAGAGPLPRGVETALARWQAQGSEARLQEVVLLRVAEPALLQRILASPAARRLVQEPLGPTVALIQRGRWPRLVVALGEMGILPDVVELKGEEEECGAN